jgi:hypothetical protein
MLSGSSSSSSFSSSPHSGTANPDHDADQEHPPSFPTVIGTTSSNPSLLKEFIEDQRNVPPETVPQYVWLVGRGIHKDIPREYDITSIGVIKKAIELGILKKKAVTITKQLLLQELKRRQEGKKLNANNKKNEELFSMLIDDSLSDADKDYIKEKISQYLNQIERAVADTEAKRKEAGGRIDMTDRLRYILALDHFGEIREAYLRSQDVLSRRALDARNSAMSGAPKDYHDLIVSQFNDSSWVPHTNPNPDLHSFFANEIACSKRECYTLTREKSKQLLLDMKHKLNDICKRYERSGNGAGQLDSDDEDSIPGNDMNFGRFSIELARLKGGDDRQNFLLHEPVDLLYWWDKISTAQY